jgi:hypothetical protein
MAETKAWLESEGAASLADMRRSPALSFPSDSWMCSSWIASCLGLRARLMLTITPGTARKSEGLGVSPRRRYSILTRPL